MEHCRPGKFKGKMEVGTMEARKLFQNQFKVEAFFEMSSLNKHLKVKWRFGQWRPGKVSGKMGIGTLRGRTNFKL